MIFFLCTELLPIEHRWSVVECEEKDSDWIIVDGQNIVLISGKSISGKIFCSIKRNGKDCASMCCMLTTIFLLSKLIVLCLLDKLYKMA